MKNKWKQFLSGILCIAMLMEPSVLVNASGFAKKASYPALTEESDLAAAARRTAEETSHPALTEESETEQAEEDTGGKTVSENEGLEPEDFIQPEDPLKTEEKEREEEENNSLEALGNLEEEISGNQEASVIESVTGAAVSKIELSLPLYQEGSSEIVFEERKQSRETLTFYDYILEGLREAKKKIPLEDYLKNLDRAKQIEVVKQTVTNVINDNPDLFYVKKTVTCYMDAADQNMLAILPSYKATGTKLQSLREALEERILDALSWVEEGMSEKEKALALHEYLTLHTYISTGGSLENGAYGAYGALVDGKAVSQGYALAYRLLLSRVGIDSEVVISTKDNKTGHYWNIVKLDGKYYHIDVERDDSDGTKKEADRYDDMGYSLHDYFMLSDAAMKKYRDTWYAKGLTAEDTSYDREDYFLRAIQKGMFYQKGFWYFVSSEGTLQKTTMAGELQTVDTVHFGKASTIAKKGKELYVNVNFLSGMIGIAGIDLENENFITNIWYFLDNAELNAADNQIEITNLEVYGEKLRYVVRDKKKTPPDGFSIGTVSLSELGGIGIPDKIKDLRVSAGTTASVTLSWSAVEGASEYLIYESSEKEYRLLARTKKTALKITGLPKDQVFEYEVMATKKETAGKKTVYWMGESAYVMASVLPDTPKLTKITPLLEGGISLFWETADGADGYEVYRQEKKSEAWQFLGAVTGLEFQDQTAVYGTSYTYKLRAYKQLDGMERTVTPFSKTEKVEYKLPAPKTLEAASAGYRSVRLRWPNVGADGYTIYRSAKEDGKFQAVKNISEQEGEASEFEAAGLTTGNLYYFRVVPYHLSGSRRVYGEASKTVTAAALPATPAAITVSVSGGDSVLIRWEKTAGADGYILTEEKSGNVLAKMDAKTLSYEWKGLEAGKEYQALLTPYRKVKKEEIKGEESRIRFLLKTFTGDENLSPPVIEEVVSLSAKALAVSFGAIEGAFGYGVYRAEDTEDGTYVFVGNTLTNNFTDGNLECGKTYYYKVCVMTLEKGQADGKAQIKYHDLSKKAVSGIPVPNGAAVSIKRVSNASCQLTWDKNPEASGYTVYRREEKAETYQIVKNLTSTAWKDTKLILGKTYEYRVIPYKTVRGRRIYGDIPEEAISFTAFPAAPKIGSVKKSGYQSVALNWKRTPGMSGYKIYYSDLKKEGFQDPVIVPVDMASPAAISVTYKNSGIIPNKTAYFKISAYLETENGVLESELSSVKAIKILPEKPVLSFQLQNAEKIEISWKDQEADGYLLYRSDKKSSGYRLIADTADLSVTDAGSRLIPGKSYYYKLRAYRITEKGLLYSSYSSPAIGKLLLSAPKPVLEKGQEYRLSWDMVEGAQKYEIYRASSKNGSYKQIGETDGLTFTDRNAVKGKTYYYKVRAYQTKLFVLMKRRIYGEYSEAVS